MATQQEIQSLAARIVGYSNQNVKKFNQCGDLDIIGLELGASQSVQDDADDADALTTNERSDLVNEISTQSGGSKKGRYPC